MTPYYQDDLVTIYHGDCREWMPEADVLVTDPPYGVGYTSHRGTTTAIAGDQDVAARDAVLEAWGARPAIMFYSPGQPPAGASVHLVWDKGTGGNGNAPWPMTHEGIAVLNRWWAPVPEPGRAGSSILRYVSPTLGGRGIHPTEKPVALMIALLARCPEGTVLDPFMGSGSTLVAAKSLGRRAIGIEIEEKYCEIAARRCSQEVLGLSYDVVTERYEPPYTFRSVNPDLADYAAEYARMYDALREAEQRIADLEKRVA